MWQDRSPTGWTPAFRTPRPPAGLRRHHRRPAADSLIAILILREIRGETLAGQAIVLAVLDLDDRGPAVGERALRTLGA
jgi:hypothetical protein